MVFKDHSKRLIPCIGNRVTLTFLKQIVKTMRQHSLVEFEELVLLAVAVLHDQAYGVSILETLEEKLERPVTLTAVHIALMRLQRKGFVTSKFGGITKERGGRRKRLYVVTALGKKMLDTLNAFRNGIYMQKPYAQQDQAPFDFFAEVGLVNSGR